MPPDTASRPTIKALKYTSLNQLARLALGPMVLLVLPFFLSVEVQGYWFTMTSITAILAFADMGLSAAVLQCAAHEHAKLQQAADRGDEEAAELRRGLAALLAYSLRRNLIIVAVALPCVLCAGAYLLNGQGHAVRWEIPWVLLCVASSASLTLTVILAFHEGCDGVAAMQRLRALVTLIHLVTTLVGLTAGWALWTLPLATGLSTAIGFAMLRRRFPPHARWKASRERIRGWQKEVSPLLTKYAASWVGGYLMFQLFTPLVFKFEGAAAAGQVGLTISAFTAIFALSNVWSAYQTPKFSMAVATQNRPMLDRCLRVALQGSILTYLLLMTCAIVAFAAMKDLPQVTSRLLSIEALAALALVWLLQIVVHNLAIYLRAFKDDPLVWPTLLAALHTITTTLLCLHFFDVQYLFFGFLTVYAWFLPAVVHIFIRKRATTRSWLEGRPVQADE